MPGVLDEDAQMTPDSFILRFATAPDTLGLRANRI